MIAALALAFAGVLASVTYRLFETDVWQHLLVGRAIWTLGAVPVTQQWSWQNLGEPEMNSAWLFRALVWKAWSWGSVWGLQIWRWVTTLAAFALLWATARRLGARGFAALLALIACALVYRLRSQIRPETLVAIYLAATLWILETRRQGGPDRTAFLPVVALLWANTHLSWFLGMALLGIHWLDEQIAAWRRAPRPGGAPPRPHRLLLVALACFAVSFANPFGARGLWQPFDFALHWRNEPMFAAIGELQRLPAAALLWNGVGAVLLLWPLLMLWRALPRRRAPVPSRGGRAADGAGSGVDVVEILTFVLFAAFAWSSLRFLGYVALVAVPYLARDLDAFAASWRWPAWTAPAWRRAALTTIAGLALGLPAWSAPGTGIGVGLEERHVPVRAADFMAEHGVRGRGFNHFHFGGYLLYRFWPERDRLPFATIHPEALRREDRLGYEAARTDPGGWAALEARHRFDYAVLYRKQLGGDVLLDVLDADSAWALVFLDDVAALYVRRSGPLAGIAKRFAYSTVPAGRRGIGALGRAAQADGALRARAAAELRRQIAASPWNAMASSVLATFALMEGRRDEAAGLLRAALAVDPALPRAHERLGMIALEAGRPADAVRELERELTLAAGAPATGLRYQLGRAYQALGDEARARAHFRAELRRDPGFAPAREALRALDARRGG
jgi:hypothetical protein